MFLVLSTLLAATTLLAADGLVTGAVEGGVIVDGGVVTGAVGGGVIVDGGVVTNVAGGGSIVDGVVAAGAVGGSIVDSVVAAGAVGGSIVDSVVAAGAVGGVIVDSGVVAGAVGGGIVDSGVVAVNVSGVIASEINWNGKNWAASCQFIGNDLTNALTRAKDCGGCCASTPGCTHYTWTNYNGGTCWMKKNSVSKNNAVPKHDQGAVCGVVAGNVSGVIANQINWNGKNWAASCQFIGNDLTNALTRAKDCGGCCASTPGCTHYTWTNYNGGTCWMKKNSVSKNNAVPKHDQGAVCGVVAGNVSGVIANQINWNGKNWAASCQFIGNDLTNALTRAKDCGGCCASTPGCTHYTWTNYNGGTCWMKKNSVSKNNAVPKHDQGAVCGVTIGSAGEVITGSVGGVGASGTHWDGNNWVAPYDLLNNDLTNVLIRAEGCGWQCMSTPSCTHHTLTNYNGRTCWMKKNSDYRINVATTHDQGLFIDYFRRSMPYYNQIIINLV